MSSGKLEGLASGDSSESARNHTQTPGVVTDQPPSVPPHLSTTHQPPPLPPRPRSRPPSPLSSQHPVVPLPPFSPLNPIPSLLTVPALHTDPFVTPNHSPVRNDSAVPLVGKQLVKSGDFYGHFLKLLAHRKIMSLIQ